MIALSSSKLSRPLLALHLAPMFLVAWTRTFAVVLPGVIETFDLPAGEAGLFVFMVEMGSFLSLLLLGFVIDQVGAFWGLRVGLVMLMVALLATAQVRQFSLLPLALLLLGSGIAWTATSINTLMAAMGERRSYYLGLMHSFYGFAAVLAPMVAGVVMAWDTWQSYYRLLSALSLGMFILVWKFEVGRESTGKGASEDDVFADADVKGAGWSRGLSTLKPIAGICLGVFALAGVQNVLNTWIYLYTSHTYNANHGQATLSPTVYWIGILLGRVGLIFLSEKYSARCLLIALSLLPAGALWIDHSGGTYWLALPAFFFGRPWSKWNVSIGNHLGERKDAAACRAGEYGSDGGFWFGTWFWSLVSWNSDRRNVFCRIKMGCFAGVHDCRDGVSRHAGVHGPGAFAVVGG